MKDTKSYDWNMLPKHVKAILEIILEDKTILDTGLKPSIQKRSHSAESLLTQNNIYEDNLVQMDNEKINSIHKRPNKSRYKSLLPLNYSYNSLTGYNMFDPFIDIQIQNSIENPILTSKRTLNRQNNVISQTYKIIHKMFHGKVGRKTENKKLFKIDESKVASQNLLKTASSFYTIKPISNLMASQDVLKNTIDDVPNISTVEYDKNHDLDSVKNFNTKVHSGEYDTVQTAKNTGKVSKISKLRNSAIFQSAKSKNEYKNKELNRVNIVQGLGQNSSMPK